MTRSGRACRLESLGHPTCESECGSWPTPRATDGERGGWGDLLAMVRTGKGSRRREWGTPRASAGIKSPLRDPKAIGNPKGRLEDQVALEEGRAGGRLNPTWVEWLMGFPLGWTGLPLSAMPSSRRSLSGSGGGSSSTRKESAPRPQRARRLS
jgi:hypothetical protein